MVNIFEITVRIDLGTESKGIRTIRIDEKENGNKTLKKHDGGKDLNYRVIQVFK